MRIAERLGSVRLTVVLLAVIAVACLVGTFVPQERSYALVYGAVWFIALLAALAVNLFCCMLNRFHLWRRRPGFVVIHCSLFLVVAGVLADAIWGERGTAILHIGESTATIKTARGELKLPFTLGLADFVVERYSPTLGLAVFQGNAHEPVQMFEVKSGGVYALGNSAGKVRVEEVRSGIEPQAKLAATAQDDGQPAVRIALDGPGRTKTEDFLLAGLKEELTSDELSLRVVFRVFADLKARDRALGELTVPIATNGMVEVAVAATPPVTIEVAPGNQKTLPDGTTVRVLRYIPHFVVVNGGGVNSASEKPVNPAVQVEIVPPGGGEAEKAWLFAKFPDFRHAQKQSAHLRLKYVRPASLDYAVTVSLYGVRDGDLVYAVMRPPAAELQRGAAEPGAAITLGPKEGNLVVIERLPRARMIPGVQPAKTGEGHWGGLVRYVAEGKPQAEPVWLLDGDEPAPLDHTGIALAVFTSEARIKAFKSAIQILENGAVVKEQTVEVNHSLSHKGYSFYQSSYDREQEKWSGIEVAKSPGVPLIYAGFTLFIVGMVIALYVQPLLASRDSKPKAKGQSR